MLIKRNVCLLSLKLINNFNSYQIYSMTYDAIQKVVKG